MVMIRRKKFYFIILFLLKFVRTTVGEMASHQAMEFSRPRFHFLSNHAPELKVIVLFPFSTLSLSINHTLGNDPIKREHFFKIWLRQKNNSEFVRYTVICTVICNVICQILRFKTCNPPLFVQYYYHTSLLERAR